MVRHVWCVTRVGHRNTRSSPYLRYHGSMNGRMLQAVEAGELRVTRRLIHSLRETLADGTPFATDSAWACDPRNWMKIVGRSEWRRWSGEIEVSQWSRRDGSSRSRPTSASAAHTPILPEERTGRRAPERYFHRRLARLRFRSRRARSSDSSSRLSAGRVRPSSTRRRRSTLR